MLTSSALRWIIAEYNCQWSKECAKKLNTYRSHEEEKERQKESKNVTNVQKFWAKLLRVELNKHEHCIVNFFRNQMESERESGERGKKQRHNSIFLYIFGSINFPCIFVTDISALCPSFPPPLSPSLSHSPLLSCDSIVFVISHFGEHIK